MAKRRPYEVVNNSAGVFWIYSSDGVCMPGQYNHRGDAELQRDKYNDVHDRAVRLERARVRRKARSDYKAHGPPKREVNDG